MQGEVSATVTEAEIRLEPTVIGGSTTNFMADIEKNRKDKNDTSWNVTEGSQGGSSNHTEYFYSGGATTMNFIVNGANAVNSFIMRSTIPWNMVAPNDNTTWRANSCGDQRRTS